jgi:hypothetical protein
MRIVITIILSVFLLSNCRDTKGDGLSKNNSRELVPEPDGAERLKYEALPGSQNPGCLFLNPDTSVFTLNIRDLKSGEVFIGDVQPRSEYHYRFYSRNFQQLLSLTQHPGDGRYQISIFRVEYAKKDDYGYPQIDVNTFKTEKGIMLGMSKGDIVKKLGSCYEAIDSTKEYIELHYRIESPQDTRTHLLANHNMPIYHALYKIRNGGLEMFEFGFDYP